MAENKKSFIAYSDWYEMFKALPDDVAGKLIKHIFSYVNDENPSTDDFMINALFAQVKQNINNQFSRSNKQEKHWNWKGGISKNNLIIRNSTKMKDWKKDVFKRDNYTCQKCNKISGILHAHHIKPFSEYKNLRFDLDNGITLCRDCHIEIHKKKNNG